MAYGLLYYNEFTSARFNKLVRVEILKNNYLGSSSQKKIGAVLNLENSGDERYEPIKKTTATLSLFSESDREFAEFYTNSSKKFRVDIYRGGSLVWSGFIEADSYSEPYAFDSNYIVEVTARDNLGTLDNIDFLDSNGDRYTGLDTAFNIINKCLAKTGLNLPLIDEIGIWSDTMTETFVTTAQASIVQDVFVDDNGDVLSCYEVLEKILGGYGAQIRQSGGEWIMREMGNFYDLNKRTEGEYKWLNKSSSLVFKEAWKQFTINQDYKKPSSFFENFPTSEDDFAQIDSFKATIKNWSVTGTYFFHVEGATPSVQLIAATNGYGESTSQTVKATSKTVKIELDCIVGSSGVFTPSLSNLYVDVFLISSGTTRILNTTGWETYTSQSKLIEFTNFSASSLTTLTLYTQAIPEDGEIKIRIYAPQVGSYDDYLSFKDIRFSMWSQDDVNPTGATITATIDDENNLTPSDFELSIGQVPVEENSILTYFGGLYSSSGAPLVNWHRQGDTNEYNLLEVVGRGYNTLYKQYSYQITGEIFWDWDFLTNIQEDSRVLLVNSGSWDLNSDQANFEFIEVFDYNNAAPIVISSGQVTDGDTNNFFQTSESKDFLAYTIDEGSPKRITDLTSITDPTNYSFILDYAIDTDSKRISYADLKSKITEGYALTSQLHDAVTITGENYASLSGQQITFNKINLASNITGTLADANLSSNVALRDAINTAGNLSNVVYSDGTGGDNYVYGLTGRASTRDYFDISGVNKKAGFYWSLDGTNAPTNTSYGNIHVPLSTNSTFAFELAGREDRFFLRSLDLGAWKSWREIYHSGNANNSSTPWNASTISTNGTTRIDASGNYTGGSGTFSNKLAVLSSDNDIATFKGGSVYNYGTLRIVGGINKSPYWRGSFIGGNIRNITGLPEVRDDGFRAAAIGFGTNVGEGYIGLFATTSTTVGTALTEIARVNSTGIDVTGNVVASGTVNVQGFEIDRRNDIKTGYGFGTIFETDGGTGGIRPNEGSHLVIQTRSNANRDIIFVTGSSPVERVKINVSGIDINGNVVASGLLKESGTFTSGFSGNNWQLDPDDNSQSHLTIDRLTVRNRMDVYEFVINQIRATNGALWVSDATKIETVSGTTLSVNDDTDITFAVNDIVKAQQFDGRNVRSYTARVTSVGTTSFTVTDVVGTGWDGMELVRIGNSSDTARQGAIYLTSSDSGSPYIDVIDGVTSASLSGKTRMRIGKLDGVSGQTGYGIWGSRNGSEESFVISSDGYARIAGWSFSATTLYAGTSLGANSITMYNLSSNTRGFRVAGANSNSFTEMYWRSSSDWGIRGRTNSSGNYDFTLGSTNQIAGWNFTNTLLSSGNIQISSSGYIRHSSDYWRLNSDGSGILANGAISWNTSGTLSVNRITAVTGTIGGFTIDANSIYSGTKQSSDTYSASGITIASAGGIRSKEFYISSADGSAHFKGTLEAATGTFGGLTVKTNGFRMIGGVSNGFYFEGAGQNNWNYYASDSDGDPVRFYGFVEESPATSADVYMSVENDCKNVYNNGNLTVGGTFSNPSDRRLKYDIVNSNSIDKIMRLRPVDFRFKKSKLRPTGLQHGFIAQDIQKIYPELVQEKKGYLTVNYLGLISENTSAIQALYKTIEELQKKILKLESDLNNRRLT